MSEEKKNPINNQDDPKKEKMELTDEVMEQVSGGTTLSDVNDTVESLGFEEREDLK